MINGQNSKLKFILSLIILCFFLFLQILNARHHILAERTSGYLINLISKDMAPIHHVFSNLRSLFSLLEIILVFSFVELCRLANIWTCDLFNTSHLLSNDFGKRFHKSSGQGRQDDGQETASDTWRHFRYTCAKNECLGMMLSWFGFRG